MIITNETVIKAAKAAGLSVRVEHGCLYKGLREGFYPVSNDTDNAMIMDGADISIAYHLDSVSASFYLDEHGMHSEPQSIKKGKAQARREAVILCAAAKWDVMNEGVK